MELKLEIIKSVAIQRKKPWPKFAWLGNCNDSSPASGLFLLDNTRISQLSLVSGKTKRNFPSLACVQSQLSLTSPSASGSLLGGLTLNGDMFIWHQPSQLLCTYTTPLSTDKPPVGSFQGCHLFLSDSGEQALLVSSSLEIYLWELTEGHCSEWWQITAPEGLSLPCGPETRETAIDACFFVHQTLGECCQCNVVFTNRETNETIISHLLLTWKETSADCYMARTADVSTSRETGGGDTSDLAELTEKKHDENTPQRRVIRPLQDRTNLELTPPFTSEAEMNSPHSNVGKSHATIVPESIKEIPVNVTWKTCTAHRAHCQSSPCGRGCYVSKISPTGSISAVAVNHSSAADTHVLFADLLNEVSLSSTVYMKTDDTMSGRTFWITSVAWSADGLLLACMTCRGCLIVLPRFGPPLKLVTSGCGLDMGPTQFLPLHPLITVVNKDLSVTDHETSQSSERDALRQRFSVTTHPHLPLVLCSDGYCLTVLSLQPAYRSLPQLVLGLVKSCRYLLHLPELQLHLHTDGIAQHSHTTPDETQERELNRQQDMCMHVTEEERGEFTSTLPGPSAEFLPAIETGQVHFAGMDGLNLTHSVFQGDPEGEYVLAKAYIFAAWGLLLSADKFEPGNGLYPCHPCGTEATIVSTMMKAAENLTIISLASLPTLPSLAEVNSNQLSCITLALSLAGLDQTKQGHCKLVHALANCTLMTVIAKLHQAHRGFALCDSHTARSMEVYVQTVAKNLQLFWKILFKIVVFVSGLYDQVHNNPLKPFSIPLLFLEGVCTLLKSDLHSCRLFARRMTPVRSVSSSMHEREMSFLQQTLMKHISNTATYLESISTTLSCFHQNHQEGSLNAVAVLAPPPLESESFPESSHMQQNMLSCLLVMLQKCDLKGALGFAHSLMIQSDHGSGEGPSCHVSVPGLILSSPASLAHQSVALTPFSCVLLTLARLIAAFFCNKLPTVVRCRIPFPTIHPPSHTAPSPSQHLELKHHSITTAIREQGLSEKWTATHAVELYLLSGHWYEAAAFAAKLGDWKKSLLLCVVHLQHGRQLAERYELSSPVIPELSKVQRLAHHIASNKISNALGLSKLAQSYQPSDHDLPYISSILWVCGCGHVDNIAPELGYLSLCRMWMAVRSLPVRVPQNFYLPAPPLYCPQPTTNEVLVHSLEEHRVRQVIAHLVLTYRSILQASGSLEECHQWYSSALVSLHHTSSDHIRLKYMPSTDGSSKDVRIPHSLCERAKAPLDLSNLPHSVQFMMAMFREFCALLWLLHVRDNASRYLRQIFHCLPLNKVRPPHTSTTEESVLWCVRLLPFHNCLAQENSSEIEDVLLSTISELPCSSFMATVLARCFPYAQFEQNHRLQLKMNRLLSRMRSTVVQENSCSPAHPLSVEYQTKSQAMLDDQVSLAVKCFSPHCFQSEDPEHKMSMGDDAVNVGTYMFEYDQAYLEFLDTLFSITSATSSVPQQAAQFNSTQMYVSSMSSQPSHNPRTGHKGEDFETCWESNLSLVASLYEWSQSVSSSIHSQRPPSFNAASQIAEKQGSKENNRRLNTTTMRIDISLSFLTYCLQLEEKKCQAISKSMRERDGATQSPPSCTAATHPVSENSMTTVTPDPTCTLSAVSTLCEEDSDHFPIKPEQLSVHVHSEVNGDGVLLSKQHPYPMLIIPDEVHVALMKTPPSTTGPQLSEKPGLTETASTVATPSDHSESTLLQSSSDHLVSFSLDMDMSESQSTGEIPSQITFSIGELGSRENPENPDRTTTELAQLQGTYQPSHGGRSVLHKSVEHHETTRDYKSHDVGNSSQANMAEDKDTSLDNERTCKETCISVGEELKVEHVEEVNGSGDEGGGGGGRNADGGKGDGKEGAGRSDEGEHAEGGEAGSGGKEGGTKGYDGGDVGSGGEGGGAGKEGEGGGAGRGGEGGGVGSGGEGGGAGKGGEGGGGSVGSGGEGGGERSGGEGGDVGCGGEGGGAGSGEESEGTEERDEGEVGGMWDKEEGRGGRGGGRREGSVERLKDGRKLPSRKGSNGCEGEEEVRQLEPGSDESVSTVEGARTVLPFVPEDMHSREHTEEMHQQFFTRETNLPLPPVEYHTVEDALPATPDCRASSALLGGTGLQTSHDTTLKLPQAQPIDSQIEGSSNHENTEASHSPRSETDNQEPVLMRSNIQQEEQCLGADIGKIVRFEMKKILQIQHRQLVNMLEANFTGSGEDVSHQQDEANSNLKSNPNRPLHSPTDTQYKHTSSLPQNTQPATGESVLDKQSVSGDLSIGDLCDDRSTLRGCPFPLLTVKSCTLQGEQAIVYHPQPEAMKGTHTTLRTTLPLLHVNQDGHTCTNLICSPQTTDVDKGSNHERQPITRPQDLQVNIVPLTMPPSDAVGKEETTLHPFPLTPQPGAANISEGLPLLQCQPPSSTESVKPINSCQKRNMLSRSTIQMPPDLPSLPATADRGPSGSMSHPPLLFLPEEKLVAHPIQPPPPTMIDIPIVPIESRNVNLAPGDIAQTEMTKPMMLLQIEGPVPPAGNKLLQLPSQRTTSATEDGDGATTEEPQPVVTSNTNSGETKSAWRHRRSRRQRQRNKASKEKSSLSLPTAPDDSISTTSTQECIPQTKTDEQQISAEPSQVEKEGRCVAPPQPKEVAPSCERLEIRRLRMNATYLPSDAALEDEKEESASGSVPQTPSESNSNLISQNESEEVTQNQPTLQTPDNGVQAVPCSELAVPDRVKHPSHFIRITDIEDEVQSISSSEEQQSESALSPQPSGPRESLSGEQMLGQRESKSAMTAATVDTADPGQASGTGSVHDMNKAESEILSHKQERTQSQQWCTVGGMEQEGLARGQVLSQFQQMEEQLCAIESTARMVEGELKASNKLLDTIDQLQTATTPIDTVYTTAQPAIGYQQEPHRRPPNAASAVASPSDRETEEASVQSGTLQNQAPRSSHTNHTLLLTASSAGNLSLQVATQPVTQKSLPKTDLLTTNRIGGKGHVQWKDSSLPPPEYCSRKKLRKWISKEKLSIIPSAPDKNLSTAHTQTSSLQRLHAECRKQRRVHEQEHKTRRFEDAFTLMEDILSSEPPKLSTEKAKQGIIRKNGAVTHARGHGMNKVDLVLPRGSCARYGMSAHNNEVQQIPDTIKLSLVRSEQCQKGETNTMLSTSHQPSGLLTTEEQMRMAQILACTEMSSISSGSVATNIDWEEVEKLLEN